MRHADGLALGRPSHLPIAAAVAGVLVVGWLALSMRPAIEPVRPLACKPTGVPLLTAVSADGRMNEYLLAHQSIPRARRCRCRLLHQDRSEQGIGFRAMRGMTVRLIPGLVLLQLCVGVALAETLRKPKRWRGCRKSPTRRASLLHWDLRLPARRPGRDLPHHHFVDSWRIREA